MKNKLYILFTLIIAVGLLASCQTTETVETFQATPIPVVSEPAAEVPAEVGFGSAGAFDDRDADLEQMLVYAIQDEYAARAEYEYLINELDASQPFTNIITAEVTHIELLLPLFEAYGYTIPEDTSAEHLIPAGSITEALEAGVLAEINNIAMYDQFLEQDLPDDIEAAFISLRDASKNHQAAFQTKLDRN